MLQRGADSYTKANQRAQDEGRGSETTYGRKLLKEFLLPLVEDLQAFLDEKTAGRQGKVRPLLRLVDPEKSLFFALKCIFNSFMDEQVPIGIAVKIGRMVEDEVRFTKFQDAHSDYYKKIILDFKRKGTTDYRYMHRVLTHKANEHEDNWQAWSQRERAEVGMKLMDVVMVGTDLIQKTSIKSKGKDYVILEPTPAARVWIDQHEEFNKLLFPERLPCIIPPDPWTGPNQGGYFTPELRNSTPLLRCHDTRQKKLLAAADMQSVMDAMNSIQATNWEVNAEVHSVAKAVWAMNLGIGMPLTKPLTEDMAKSPVTGVPAEEMTEKQKEDLKLWKREASEVYTQERERVSKSFQTARIMRLANEYAMHEEFWYVWYCDFRGRLYTATAGFSPQGPDLAKGLLRFRSGKPLGDRGLYWLRVHGANRYGNDKGSYDDRAEWVIEHEREFLRAADDPLSYKDVWAKADKPYQFLAFLFEYRDALAAQAIGVDYVSRLPIGLDGSCNGLQNFSAMLRDEVGGKATNLVPADRPSDIYAAVAKVCTDKLRALPATDEMAARWISFCDTHGAGSVPRSMAKRPVMTLPYGATRQSCTKYIFQSILDTDRAFFDSAFAAACWLTPYLWTSIGDVVVAARNAMQWLQGTAGVISKANEPITWITPDGFPAYQVSNKIETVQIETQLAGRFQVRIGTFIDAQDPTRHRLAISPNFVHSMDATHLRETVRRASRRGVSSLALIHDDYGTHAADTDVLHECIREAFVAIYSDHNVLADYREHQERTSGVELKPVPDMGALEIRDVINSKYFFG